MLVGLRPVDCRAIDRAAGSRAGQQREPEHQEPRPAALAPQERLPRLLCLVVMHQFSPKLWCIGGMVGASWLTKRDRTGGPEGARAGLALAGGGGDEEIGRATCGERGCKEGERVGGGGG